LDHQEPLRIAQAVKVMGLKHVVVTSVTRDDIPDGGADIFCRTVSEIRRINPQTKIELLIPDFNLKIEALRRIVSASPDIIAHNLETVPSLYPLVRSGSDYARSLEVLKFIKSIDRNIPTKSGLMLGLGEKKEEVFEVFKDLRNIDCDFLSIGQYLAPSLKHYPVREYINPQQFDEYKRSALSLGFKHVACAPYVRSSYMAEQYLNT
jgi:lipoyl synthase